MELMKEPVHHVHSVTSYTLRPLPNTSITTQNLPHLRLSVLVPQPICISSSAPVFQQITSRLLRASWAIRDPKDH